MMPTIKKISPALLIAAFLMIFWSSLYPQGWQSAIVHYDGTGKLVYIPDASGNRIPDFSHAGYKGGGVPVPAVPDMVTISPVAGDNTSNIQNAVNQVGAMPLDGNGIRGAVRLNPGIYRVSGIIRINFDGVVLRGSGQGSDSLTNSIIVGTGNTPAERDIIVAGGGSNTKWSGSVSGTQTNLIDDTVYVGSKVFHVQDPSAYGIGDNIIIYHPCSDPWLQAVDYGGTNGTELWTVGSQPLVFNRYITGINGNEITIDVPVYNTLVKSLSQSYIYKYNRSGIKTNIGIENLRVDITGWEPDTLDQSSSAWSAIALSQIENGWVKNFTATHFVYACVRTETATRITIDSCNGLNPVGSVDPADVNHRRYSFALDDASQQVLMMNCLATNGRHSFMSNGTSWVSGCVFYNVKVYNPYAPSEPHRRWSMGILYDNFVQLNGPLSGYSSELLGFYNRGDFGTGHGWAAAHCVAWNCDVAGGDLLVQKPPTAQNYAVGCFGDVTGTKPPAPFVQPTGYIEGTNAAGLNPPSLYMAQLQERLGTRYTLKSGNWSDPASWSGNSVPSAGEDAAITGGDTIIIDMPDASCNDLTVGGMLQFPNNIDGRGITVNGSVSIGSAGAMKTITQAVAGTALVHSITIYGDLINSGIFDMRSGSGSSLSSNTINAANVTFAGGGNSSLRLGVYSTTANEFNALTIDKSSGGKLLLQSDLFTNTSSTVAGAVVTFSNGVVETGPYTLVSLATSSASIVGGSPSSYVNGNLARARSSTPGVMFYPVGDHSGYRPISVYTNTAGMTTKHYLTAGVISGNADNGSSLLTGGIGAVSGVRYYRISYTQDGSTSPSMTFYKFSPSYGADDSVTAGLQNLRVAASADDRATWTGHGPADHVVNLDSPPTVISSDSIASGQITLADGQSAYITLAYEIIPPPPAPILLSPADAETLRSTSVLLIWGRGSSGEYLYWAEYSEDSSFSLSTVDSALTDTTYQISGLTDGQRYYWRVRSKNLGGLWGEFSAVRSFMVAVTEPRQVGIKPGWNLISLPVVPADPRKSELFPTAVSDLFAFIGGYVTAESLSPGFGYWLKFDSAETVTVRGIPVIGDTVAVKKGWNLVGAVSEPLPEASVVTLPDSLIISNWYRYDGSYILSDTLQPFTGYWVKVKGDGVLVLPGYGGNMNSKRANPIFVKPE